MQMRIRSKKQQRIAAELGEIITEMGQAMWNADQAYIAEGHNALPLTAHMTQVLWKFYYHCKDNYGK